MIIDFIIEDLMLNSYLQKNFHTLGEERGELEDCKNKSKLGKQYFPLCIIIVKMRFFLLHFSHNYSML